MSILVRLLAIALVMSAILAGLVARHAWLRETGQEIYLAMEPVDPRDLLLGHYVVLETGLHQLDTAALDGPDDGWMQGQAVHVTLRETEDGSMIAAGAFQEPPSPPFILGRIAYVASLSDLTEPETLEDGSPGWSREPIPGTEREQLRVRYNLERYYAPREQAMALEAMRTENRLRLIVSLGPDGHAVIKGLEIDGEPHYDTLH